MNKIANIGTYITRIENVIKTEVDQMVNYLVNEEHGHHLSSDILNTLQNREEYLEHNGDKIAKNTEMKKGKGGKPLKVSNKSLTFNIPKDYEASEQQAIDIQLKLFDFIKNMYKSKGFDFKDIDYFTNIHYQENKHINFILPYLDNNGYSIPFIKSKDILKEMASEFTKITDEVLGTQIENYQTATAALETAEKELENIENLTLEDISLLKVKYKDNKLLKRTYDYLYRLLNNPASKNQERLNATIDKLITNEEIPGEDLDELIKVINGTSGIANLPDAQYKALKAKRDKRNTNPKI